MGRFILAMLWWLSDIILISDEQVRNQIFLGNEEITTDFQGIDPSFPDELITRLAAYIACLAHLGNAHYIRILFQHALVECF